MNVIGIAAFLFAVLTTCAAKVKTLDENDWHSMLSGEWMVKFFAPWCPACNALQPTWEELSTLTRDIGVSLGKVDVTVSPGLSGRFMVTALPTIFHVKDGQFRQYRGSRDVEAFLLFLKEKKWSEVEPIPSWKSPSSYQMAFVAFFFKLSQILRSTHSQLTDHYGLPTWSSYLIFAFATIIFGGLLGLGIVFFIDLFYPPKIVGSSNATGGAAGKHAKDSGDEEDEVEDEIVDESEKPENACPPARKRRTARKAD